MKEMCKDCYYFLNDNCTIKNVSVEYDADICILFWEVLLEGIKKSTPGMN